MSAFCDFWARGECTSSGAECLPFLEVFSETLPQIGAESSAIFFFHMFTSSSSRVTIARSVGWASELVEELRPSVSSESIVFIREETVCAKS